VNEIASVLVGVSAAFVWFALVAPLIARTCRVPLPFGLAWRHKHGLSLKQRVFAFGIWQWGISIFLYLGVVDYCDGRFTGNQPFDGMYRRCVLNLVTCTILGTVVGFASARRAENPNNSKSTI
jgi:hypothetical protein